ncbi:hypothetical protein AMAG_20331 [Allomyces macrogynus ATCC 38327]|uniref:Uncharacterized protein n=1 Tax=Allomyces macrogynus (strain ATCC 38327) TaxID=578462 RepID=A0A0L0T9Q4_ALLM3|nr:hypothetical protein AMAG_20331 [Allomyces macrogynus ATCC 38327]|eukprot:KNE71304.1 hypothetical protein AMAG_20331 [Allomyces macrogynus ATCC 38327]
MHPLDTIKTRMQAAPASGAAVEAATTATSSSVGARIAATARSVFSRQMLQIVSRGAVCVSRRTRRPRRVLAPFLPDAPTTVTTLSALVGDLASSLVKVPREVITARLQTNYYGTAPMSGTAVAQHITPLDVLRTRVMTAKPGANGQRSRVGIVGGLQQIYKEGGMRGLYRGSVARGTWWLCVCSMFFPIYEATKMTAAEYL